MSAKLYGGWGYKGDKMALPVASVDEAVPFYTDVLGFRLESVEDEPHRRAVLERDDVRIGLAENGGDPTQDGCAFGVDSVEGLIEEFRSHGLDKQLSDISSETNDGGTYRVVYVVAPDGLCYWFGEKTAE